MAMLNWQGWAANFLGWGDSSTSTATATPSVGHVGRRRVPPRRQIQLEFNGETYIVDSEDEFDALIERLQAEVKAAAQRRALKAIRKATRKPDRAVEFDPPPMPAVVLPEFVEVPDQIFSLDALWRQTYLDAITEFIHREQEDDEAAVQLMLSEIFRL